MSDDDRAWMVRVEAGRLSASDLEHPDLQPLLLPLDQSDGHAGPASASSTLSAACFCASVIAMPAE